MRDAASSSSEEVSAPRRDVCDSWWTFLWCHGTDEEGAVDEEALEDMARLPAPPIGDIPDLGMHMTLQSLKKKIEVGCKSSPFCYLRFFFELGCFCCCCCCCCCCFLLLLLLLLLFCFALWSSNRHSTGEEGDFIF